MSWASATSSVSPEIVMALAGCRPRGPRADFRLGATRSERPGELLGARCDDRRVYARIFIHATCLGVGRRRLLDPLPQNHGLEGEFACYPTRDLGRRRINHTRFRGTDFCAADQFFAEFYMVIFRNDYKYVYDYPELFARKALIPGS